MAVPIHKAIFYPEEYIIEEDLLEMGEVNPHTNLIDYLKGILRWLFQLEGWLVISEMNVYHPAIRNSESYIVPDVALVKIALPPEEEAVLSSWRAERMPPQVVFEVSSEGTWPNDVQSRDSAKPAIYGRIGVKEYFAYDPHTPQVWARSRGIRLRGWRYDAQGQPQELERDEQGRIWSEELQSWLVPDGRYLRLTDAAGQPRLTELEFIEAERKAETMARQQAEQRADAEAIARREAERQLEELKRQLEDLKRQQGLQ